MALAGPHSVSALLPALGGAGSYGLGSRAHLVGVQGMGRAGWAPVAPAGRALGRAGLLLSHDDYVQTIPHHHFSNVRGVTSPGYNLLDHISAL